MQVQIVDTGIGNTGSVQNMLKKLGIASLLSNQPPSGKPDFLILPGVGAFDNGIEKLKKTGWFEYIQSNQDINILGICLGMQMLCDGSDEGLKEGFGLIPGVFKKFNNKGNKKMKIPHMGWNVVNFDSNCSNLWKDNDPTPPRFYFVHSYKYTHSSSDYILAKTNYCDENFGCIIEKGNVTGFQFHPEKSHTFGICLLRNYFATRCDDI